MAEKTLEIFDGNHGLSGEFIPRKANSLSEELMEILEEGEKRGVPQEELLLNLLLETLNLTED